MADRKSKWDEPAREAQQPLNPAAAVAAAAAAKIAAQYKNAGGEGAFVHDIDINDIRNRYILTRSQTQTSIQDETGATVSAKGQWYPDRSMATSTDPPLYLHISAHSKEVLDKAVEKVNEVINSDLPQLTEDRNAKRLEYEARKNAPPQRRDWNEERISIPFESLRNFNIRAKVVGPQGMFVKFIQSETGTRVQIKGQGSGFIESQTGFESTDPMFIHITGPDASKVKEAKELADDLLDAVRTEHAKAQQNLMNQWGDYGGQSGYGSQQAGYSGQYGAGYDQGWQQNANYPAQPQVAPPPLPDDVPPPPPPEEDAPPPPAEPDTKKTAEEEALDKYWKDYIEWEKSFKAYHGRLPSKDEGLQEVPREHQSK